MSDKEVIIKSLEKVNHRLRMNHLLLELGFGVSLFLLVPVLFKAWDLYSPFRGRTVAIVLVLWLIGMVAYLVWKLSGKTALSHTAAAVDEKALLRDELKSAYWFLTNPPSERSADWVELQVRRAARRASQLNVDQLYPRVVPRSTYLGVGLLVLLIALNFAPLSNNHNWVLLEAAPAFRLSAEEQKLIEQTKKLLAEAQKLDQGELVRKLEEIVQNLEEGNIDPADALKQLDELRNTLGEGNLDMANINAGLDEMAEDLSTSAETQDVSDAMAAHDLQQTAEQLQKLAEEALEAKDPQAMKALEDALNQASDSAKPGMQDLAKDMKQAADSLANKDSQGFQEALKQASKDVQDLQQKMAEQQAKNSASQEIQNLQDQLRQHQEKQGQAQQAQQKGQQGEAQQGQKGEQGKEGESNPDDSKAEASEGSEPGAAGGEPQPGQEGQPGKAGDQAKGGASGKGQNPSGAPQAPMEIMGAPTQLNVKLEQEKLAGENDGGTPENLEEASKQERSKLDYRNVRSELSPAQKDVLNQDKIPWEYKSLIKNYFQAIRPPRGK